MRFSTQQEDFIYNPTPCYDFELRGSQENTRGENHTKNKFSSLVYFKEKENKQVEFKNSNFSQTAKELVYHLAKIFHLLLLNQFDNYSLIGQIINICHLEQIQQKYQEQKPILFEVYQLI